MTLKDTRTIIDWNEAYSSKKERMQVYCPNCGSKIEREAGVGCNPPINASNLYWCPNCEDTILIDFKDVNDWDIPLKSERVSRNCLFASGLMLGATITYLIYLLGGWF